MEILTVCLDEIGLSGLEGKWKMTIIVIAWVEMPFPSGCILINARSMNLIQAVH